jgi:hypothetical protein
LSLTCVELFLPHKIKCVYTGADSVGLEYKTKIMEDILERDSPFSKMDFGTQYPDVKNSLYSIMKKDNNLYITNNSNLSNGKN